MWLVAPSQDVVEVALAEIDAAIALVSSGVANRVRLVSVVVAAEVVPIGAARAQVAAVGFRVSRGATGRPTIEVGPRMTAAETAQ